MSGIKSLFYKLINKVSDVRFENGASDFRLMKRNMVDAILSMTEYHRFSKGIFSYVGFNTKYIPYEAVERAKGESKWGFRKLFKYAFEGIFAFSTAPLHLVTVMGSVVFGCSVVLGIHSLWKKLTGQALEGFTTVILLQLIIGSALMFCLGIIGYYIAKIYEEIKDRPRYILSQACGGKDEHEETP